ncbi:hypothetical protein Kpol_520p9 [Vanderwaltozyma polyspora DSM 70294]|uniref:Uncharacterized protein n=1 Tax=Vanderwaltozyma polyspora (strain ATCC 22028 / DSM 70294 / BCRC 21397 / CBS 2163 / NBRC 10782 / NRRL Y-8283 / UCD 57-17) TaxID=436907 RepID=A7TM94_VANPO|nr:uncharacterized protein Kpol_520p9 [Vanderwaltozyma polyspora DSM 70294]EDO16588.1 hypothetical protein Kpol_520p9 [Vanderwaltozyma polyspora DSM 70294]
MAFLQLTSEVQQPFVIPSLSPVSQPNSRKNSCASDYSNIAVTRPRKGSLPAL